MQNQYQNKNEWLEAAKEAAIHMSAGEAARFVAAWGEVVGQPADFPHNDQYIEGLRQNLLLTAFSALPDALAVYVLQNLTKQFFIGNEYQLPAEQKVEDRFVMSDYGTYEEQRNLMKNALLESQARIANSTVGSWLQKFEQFSVNTKEEKVIPEFLLREVDVTNTLAGDKFFLETVIDVYEGYLQYPVLSIYDYQVFVREQEEGTVVAEEGSLASETQEKLPLLKALSKFSNLGNQVLTENRIKIKSAVEPVRGSLSNWLKVYRDELGIGRHDAVTRAKFLFESANTKGLSIIERENIHAVIRSLEDDELLTINTNTGEIIFDSKKNNNKNVNAPHANSTVEEDVPKDLFERFAAPAPGRPSQQMAQRFVTPPTAPQASPANSLPTPLQNVGTGQFGPVSSPVVKNKESEKALLERIQKMQNHPMPEPHLSQSAGSKGPSPFAGVPGGSPGEPIGKLTFSGSQVFSGEMNDKKYTTPTTVGAPVRAIGASSAPTAKKSAPPANVFHIRPNRDE